MKLGNKGHFLIRNDSHIRPQNWPNKITDKVHFSRSFFSKNIGNFTDLHNGKNQIWKFRVNGIVSVNGTHVNVYQIS